MSVSKKNIQAEINVPEYLNRLERRALAFEILEFVRTRSQEGIAVNGNSFPKYTDAYVKSLDFKIGGKSKNDINLTLSGDMLAAMQLVKHEQGKIVIGYETSDSEAGKAEGNQIGSYGQSTGSKSKARRFIGISREDLKVILENYPEDTQERRDRAKEIRSIENFSASLSGDIEVDDE